MRECRSSARRCTIPTEFEEERRAGSGRLGPNDHRGERADGGRVGAQFEGAPSLLCHGCGASHRERQNPLMCQRVRRSGAIFAPKGGALSDPVWYGGPPARP
ncbi:MAG: nitroreductase/quinone reductase family protein [Acidimicrobiales bacterium]